ncbi:MAG: GNAT family N-acetyltransferase [Acidobacteriota bacterium]
MISDQYNFRVATADDSHALMELINEAFQIERVIFSNDRIELADVLEHMQKGTFTVTRSGDKIVGCVYTELKDGRGYFGLLSVAPSEQGRGLGAKLIAESEDLCRKAGLKLMYIKTINLRTELPPYYQKFGYTIVREEFPEIEPTALQPYHFVIMEKSLDIAGS